MRPLSDRLALEIAQEPEELLRIRLRDRVRDGFGAQEIQLRGIADPPRRRQPEVERAEARELREVRVDRTDADAVEAGRSFGEELETLGCGPCGRRTRAGLELATTIGARRARRRATRSRISAALRERRREDAVRRRRR